VRTNNRRLVFVQFHHTVGKLPVYPAPLHTWDMELKTVRRLYEVPDSEVPLSNRGENRGKCPFHRRKDMA
jgi:hypothetical protein